MVLHRNYPEPGQPPARLKDPCDDRPVSDLALPPAQVLTADTLYDKKGAPQLQLLIDHLALEGVLAKELLLDLVKKAGDLFEAEPNLLKLNDPITVVGDIHGQYFDYIKLLEVGGTPGDTQYLCLGDYVDRGSFSVEVVALMFAIKIKHPKRFRMLRGNHECRQMTSFFNFREECEYKYDIGVYNSLMECFDMLPLSATINGKFLAVHGGLSPEMPNIKAIASVNRFQEPPREGLLCDLIWSDPWEPKEEAPAKTTKAKAGPPFKHNDVRGCSYFFTFEAAAKFLQKNSLLSIIRAHEVQIEGYKMHKTNPATGFPSVITIFSAPNYCDVYNNKGAILKFDNSTMNILQFNCAPHPYYLPNFMDVFAWSMPFVVEKVTEMLFYILQPAAGKQDLDEFAELSTLPTAVQHRYRDSLSLEENKAVELANQLALHVESSAGQQRSTGPVEETDELHAARDRMRKKVRTIARMARMFRTLRQENEAVVRLKGVCPGHRLKPGLLLQGKDAIKSELELFDHVQGIDALNELRPDSEGKNGDPKSLKPTDPEDGRDFIDHDHEEEAIGEDAS
eukprot:gnl/TRDRNA2_/TRDRNA2_92772_c0_seq3.p1 gnl/TRDRNA2_/TRDRNA2_92772_c0~~gnl/TRDRNA2_/TRDRNA2_92772_c0_seq3.p1  ORF type:complete len:609 (+),score=131.38 gnl/TRDRNA2_/TRDRNA2_92772_c0_seq3:130-1827(+)